MIQTEYHIVDVHSMDKQVVLDVKDRYVNPESQSIVAFLTKEQAAVLGERLIKLSKEA